MTNQTGGSGRGPGQRGITVSTGNSVTTPSRAFMAKTTLTSVDVFDDIGTSVTSAAGAGPSKVGGSMAAMRCRRCLGGVTMQALGRVGLGRNRVFNLLSDATVVTLIAITQVLGQN
jgi:hypothetical protein